MIYYVNANVHKDGDGTKKTPFKTIGAAAELAHAGDEVLVAPGIYREYVNPRNGGTEDTPVVYRSEQPLGAIISGAESVKGWKLYSGNVWMVQILNGIFGAYNPYTEMIRGDWYNEGIRPVHCGEVYLNGKAMYEVADMAQVASPEKNCTSWDPDGTLYTWYTKQQGDSTVIYANFQGVDPNESNVEINVRQNCFMPDRTGIGYITLSGFTIRQAATRWAPPTAYQDGMLGPHWSKGWIIEDCEISDSRCSGISLGKYLQPENENKWMTSFFKDGTQTERDAICQAQAEGWNKENIGSHIVRRCNIHDCGQTGIVGHLGGVFSLIEDNHIHHINNKQDLTGAEIGGIKMHATIDVIFRRNHIHHCTRGLWLDWQAQGTRVTGNLFHDNVPPIGTKIVDPLSLAEDIFVEVSHGPTLIDNNILLSNCSCKLCAQGIAMVHNLISGSFTWVGKGTGNGGTKFSTERYTPYHMHHRTEVAGFMTILHGDVRFYNNIFIQQPIRKDLVAFTETCMINHENTFQCGTNPYNDYPKAVDYFKQFNMKSATDYLGKDIYYDHLPVYTGGNVFFNGAQPCNVEEASYVDKEHVVSLELKEKDGRYYLLTDFYNYLQEEVTSVISTEMLGEAFEPEQRFENPDGTSIIFNQDYFGTHRCIAPVAGPFEYHEGQGVREIWL